MNKRTYLLMLAIITTSVKTILGCPTCLGRLKKERGEPFFIKYVASKKMSTANNNQAKQVQEQPNKSEGSHE